MSAQIETGKTQATENGGKSSLGPIARVLFLRFVHNDARSMNYLGGPIAYQNSNTVAQETLPPEIADLFSYLSSAPNSHARIDIQARKETADCFESVIKVYPHGTAREGVGFRFVTAVEDGQERNKFEPGIFLDEGFGKDAETRWVNIPHGENYSEYEAKLKRLKDLFKQTRGSYFADLISQNRSSRRGPGW